MKVFISWSGKETKSHAVARALDEWLPTVLNAVEPWVSSRGLSAGLQWNQQLDKELDDTSFGIIVVTPWNQHSQWLNFEAGALSKRVGGLEARVAPLLIDFPNVAKLSGPLASYQAVLPTKEGVQALVVSINEALGEDSRRYEALERAFEVCWPALEAALENIHASLPREDNPADAPSPQPAPADDTDMLSEILTAVRGLARSDARLSSEIRSTVVPRAETARQHGPNIKIRGGSGRSSQSARLLREISGMGYPVRSVTFDHDGLARVILRDAITEDEEQEIVDRLDFQDFHIRGIHFYPVDTSAEARDSA